MPKIIYTFIVLLFNISFLCSDTYRIYFIDKGPEEFTEGNEIFEKTFQLYTDRAIQRREKVNKPITIQDAVLYEPYINQLTNIGGEFKAQLRYNNYVVFELDSIEVLELDNLQFVKRYTKTDSKLIPLSNDNSENIIDYTAYLMENIFEYGQSATPIKMLNIDKLHQYGLNGDSILIGIVDTGFRWKNNKLLSDINVIDEFDFIFQDSTTSNEEEDVGSQDRHGTEVLSLISAKNYDDFIGVSSNSEFLLAKTEDMRSETRIEEDYYAMALEWMESKGVDVINSSLGYKNFDNDIIYSFEELDGKTSISADIINKCVDKGVNVVVSAGNSGNKEKSIVSPADADSVISVGALKPDGETIAGFSSFGPRADGLIKPDLSAMGSSIAVINNSGTFIRSAGTSFASPVIAGASSLLLSLYPELKPYELRNILKESADHYSEPSNTFGYGKPDMIKAITQNRLGISPISYFRFGENIRVVVYIIDKKENIENAILNVRFDYTNEFKKFGLKPTNKEYLYYVDIPFSDFKLGNFEVKPAQCFLYVSNFQRQRRSPYRKESYYIINPTKDYFQAGMNVEHLITSVADNDLEEHNISLYQTGKTLIVNLKNTKYGLFSLSIIDIRGNKLFNLNKQINKYEYYQENIDISKLISGIYLIEIIYNDQTVFKKIIINN